jgi:parallel beta-helix repeat protein
LGFNYTNGVSSGSGTASSPYIIENWDINASSAHGIKIQNTDVYFIIRNCVIHDGKNDYRHGIYFNSVSNGKIENCTIYNNWNGIYIKYSSNSNIIGNHIYNNTWYGIWLSFSSNNNLTANHIHNNYDDGIHLSSSSNNNLSANQIYNNSDYGIYLYYSSNNNLKNNILENNTYNFDIYGGELSHYYQDIDTSNTINGKPIYYIIEQNNLIFDVIELGYLGLVSCSNIVVKNLNLTGNGHGLLLANTSYSTITANQIHNNSYGIFLEYSSDNNNITGNQIHNNYKGIYLESSSNNNQITSNQIYNNSQYGVYTGWGIHLHHSSNNSITSNQIYNNQDGGIHLYSSSNNNITNNHIYNNFGYGIYTYYSSNNEIHYCNIYNNTNYGVCNYNSEIKYQANATYNWWGSISGPYHLASNPNGTGDNVSDNVLYNPWLTEPVNISLSNMPPIALFTSSLTSPTTSDVIRFTDSSFGLGGEIVSWFWDFDDGNTSIEQNPQHKYSSPGNYTVKLTVTDDDGLNATYTKLITVKEEETVTNGGQQERGRPERGLDIIYLAIAGAIAGGLIVVFALLRMRRSEATKVEKSKEEQKPMPEFSSKIQTMMLRCPGCRVTFSVELKPKPFNVKCPNCGKEGMIR